MTFAPIIIFTYNRLNTLKSLIESLSKDSCIKKTPIFIYSDGPKNEKDHIAIESVRSYLFTLRDSGHFSDFTLHLNTVNLGLAASVISGVSNVIDRFGRVIVLEDDLIVSPNFLTYMNQSLNFYEKFDSVASVSGYRPNFKFSNSFPFDAFFSKRVTSWGWATWVDRWNSVDWNLENVYDPARIDLSKFGSDLFPLIKKQLNKDVDSWAIRWAYFHLINDKFSIMPSMPKVKNVGFGASATHTKERNTFFDVNIDSSNKIKFNLPTEFDLANRQMCERHINYYSLTNRILHKVVSKFKFLF